MRHLLLIAALAGASLTACGGSSANRIGPGKMKAVKLDPVNRSGQGVRGRDARAAARWSRGQRDREGAAQGLARDRRQAVEAWHDLGAIAYKDGEDDVAIEAFSKALSINPSHTSTCSAAPRRTAAREEEGCALRLRGRAAHHEEDDPNRRDAAAASRRCSATSATSMTRSPCSATPCGCRASMRRSTPSSG